jgi:hypothetical protein
LRLRKVRHVSHLVLSLVALVEFSIPAWSQTPVKPKLSISYVNLNPIEDGFYNGNVGLQLQRTDSPQVNFNLNIQHVKTLDEVYSKVRPAVDHLADELKNADDIFPH